MKGKDKFSKVEIAELERLIMLRCKTAPSGQKSIRQKMRDIGFYGKDDWGITNLQISDLRSLIKSGQIQVWDESHSATVIDEVTTMTLAKLANETSAINSFSDLRTKLEKARLKYKPDSVKYLLIAEAPPDCIDRFFYYENVLQHDYLFLGIAQAIYPDLKVKFLASRRSSDIKKSILLKFKADGFYLLDLSELPLSLLKDDLSSQVITLVEKIRKVSNEKTNIILIKATVYDTVFKFLKQEGFKNLVDIRISFPGQGGQKLFQIQFHEALKLVNYF